MNQTRTPLAQTTKLCSFFLLLLAIYFLTKEIFKSRLTSIIACILFIFNGSFAFLDFFNKFPLSFHTLTDIFRHDSFLAFGPYYGNKIISAFWSLNIYTNQRHLALAYAVFLLLVLVIYRASKNNNKLNLNKEYLNVIHEGMRKAVVGEGGTVRGLDLKYVEIAGKSGTAELGNDNAHVNSWVMGFWPYEEPRYAFVLLMERAPRSNSLGAGWVMREVFNWMKENRPEYLESPQD